MTCLLVFALITKTNKKRMKNKLLLGALFASSTAALAQTTVQPMVMRTPNEYYIIAASPNGKWACGVYADYGDERYGFLWNLESNEIELLNPADPSLAYSVSDDGVVAGSFTDHSFRSNGAATTLAGYWKDHKWHRLQQPSSAISASAAAAISPDGKYIVGHTEENGKYIGYVWKDGEILKQLQDKRGVSMPYAISPDGKYAAGWIQDENRQACIWNVEDGTYSTISNYESPWSSGRKFTPDGKTLLYFGGWDESTNPAGMTSLYDMETGDSKKLYPYTDEENFDFFDISNNNTVMCELGDLGYVIQNGKGEYAYKYLENKGVDVSQLHIFVNPDGSTDSEGNTLYQISRASTVSADDNVMGFQYYNDDKDDKGQYSISVQSMVVKFNQATNGLVPVSVKASQLSGLNSVLVTWKPNVAAKGITGYIVYRDGQKLNEQPIDNTINAYADNNVELGEHKYAVSAVYGSVESDKSQDVAITVAKKELSAPEGLYAKQHGYNSAYLDWSAPQTNFGGLTYYNAQDANIETFGFGIENVSYETAIAFDEEQLSAYKGQKIYSVGFYPLEEQGGWNINIYTHGDDGKLKQLYSQKVDQKLNYGKRNVVKLNTPQDIPSGDLIIATEVTVTTASQAINAEDYGRAVEGYSDLVRISNMDGQAEEDFSSIGQQMQASNYLYSVTWPIDATVAPANADLTKDDVKSYNIYADGKVVGNTTDGTYLLSNLAEGDHTIGVSTVYNNGNESAAANANVNITPDDSQLTGVEKVNVVNTTNTAINATWEAPADHDMVNVEYCIGDASDQGATPPDECNDFMVAALFPSKTFRGRDGYSITSARFYPLADATYTIYIYKDNDTDPIGATDVYDYTLGEWNTVKLDEPIAIDTKSTYRLVVDCYDIAQGSSPIALDNNTPVDSYSNLYSIDNGESWNPLSSNAIWANWMIGLGIENTKTVDLPVAGYDVNIDGVKKNSEMLKTTSFSYDFGNEDAKEHTIQVDVYYNLKPTSVSGDVTRFTIGTTGISENTIDRIEMHQGNNEITVSGNNVTSVTVLSTDGATVAKANGNTVSISNLTSGVYVVKAVVNGENVTKKIMIEK